MDGEFTRVVKVTWGYLGDVQEDGSIPKSKWRAGNCVISGDAARDDTDGPIAAIDIKKMLANKFLNARPDSITLFSVEPVCNCQPYDDCKYADFGGYRFYRTQGSLSRYHTIREHNGTGEDHPRRVRLIAENVSSEFVDAVQQAIIWQAQHQ